MGGHGTPPPHRDSREGIFVEEGDVEAAAGSAAPRSVTVTVSNRSAAASIARSISSLESSCGAEQELCRGSSSF